MKKWIVVLLGLGLGISSVQAAMGTGDVVCVDFGTTVPTLGNYNVIHSGNLSISNLIRFADGASVGVGLAVTAITPFDNTGNVASTAGLPHINATDADVYVDGFLSTYTTAAGDDLVMLTFTGLDESLYYDLSGALARSSNPGNFSTTWAIDGVASQVSDGTPASGTVNFTSLSAPGGTLVVSLTDNVRSCGLAQLALVATDTPPPPPVIPPDPELPAGVTVFFDPTAADSVATLDDLDFMTIGGSWDASLPDVSRFDSHVSGFVYVMDGASAQGDYLELTLDGSGLDFSATDVAINFEMLAARASATVGDKHTTLIGYDGTNEIFRLKYDSNSDNTQNTITVTTGDGDESMGFVPLRWITETSGPPSGLQDVRIVLSNGQVSFSGSSLTSQDGPVLNSAQNLTSLRWEITGSSSDNQGFWLDDIQIRNGLPDATRAATDRPNVIFILADDMGYKDLSCYGATVVDTPNLDGLASGGLQFTDFHTGANICSPSRAAFLTGAYPQRCGLPYGISPTRESHWFLGLAPEEITLAEQFRNRGYKTLMIGKWHLGFEEKFSYYNQGFDHFYGCNSNIDHDPRFFDEREVIYDNTPKTQLTSLYTQRVREHIRNYKDQPFFLYYAHQYPHTPYNEGNTFDGSTGNGTRPDVIRELDWGIGQLVAELEAQGILENTLLVFASDNGATSNSHCLPFKGTKYVTYEGGHRVPFIMYWKGQVQTPAVLDTPVRAMDLFPTLCELIGEELPADRIYDGTSLVPLLTEQPIARTADDPFYYYNNKNMQAVRVGDWKLHVPRTKAQRPWWDNQAATTEYRLYNLAIDEGESTDVSASNPDVVSNLTALAESIRPLLGEHLIQGSEQRQTGTLFPEVPIFQNLGDWNSLLTDAEKGRGKTRYNADGVVDLAGDFIDGATVPVGWQYLNASEASGGTEVALTAGTVVGSEGNTGFAGIGTAGLIGSADAGDFVIESTNTANAGVAGTDLLVVTDDAAARDFVIVRYTIDEGDIGIGKTRATITGSFRDLVGGTTDDSITAQVFRNDTELFSATGSAGRLSQAAGTFNLSDVSVAAGDTVSFVVGSNGSSEGDEVALRASIQFERETSPVDFALNLTPPVGFNGMATLQFNGTPGLSYQVERSTDLREGWDVVDEIPFLPTSPYDVHVEATGDLEFWRIKWGEE